MPVTNIRSRWDSGNLIFHEWNNLAVTGNVLTLAPGIVTIGNENNDVDFKVWMSTTAYALFDYGNEVLTLSGIDVALSGDLAITVGQVSLADDLDMEFGTGTDALMRWSTADDNNHSFVIALGDSNQGLHITDKAAVATDWNIAATTNPTVYIHSNTSPATDYLMLGDHDGTTAYIDVVGGTTLSIDIAGTPEVVIAAASTSPATSDSNALGSATLMWSDLFLASAGVINWNNGNCTIVHAAGVLTVTGDIVANNAAGPAFEDEAATTTNPTLCPNKADLTTGIGWNTNEIHLVVSGVDEVNLSASALSPGVTDSTALGTTALMWSDLFLADAGVINWNNGDTTLTATGNLLTLGASGFSIGADGAGFDVIFYGDRTGSDFFWDQDGQTNGSLNLGTTTVSEGVDFFAHGDTADTYLHWDCSADDLLLVGAGLYFSGTQADEVIQIGGTYDHGIRFTEDMAGGDVTNSFINIGDYTTAIAVVPAGANMFGEMHNVTLTDVDVAYWYQAKYIKITTSGTTTATSVAAEAIRMQIGSDLEAVYGIQCHTNITATNACNQEIISVSALVDLGAGTATTTDRVVALQAMFSGSGTAGTVVGDAIVAYIVNAGTVITTDSIIEMKNQSAATAVTAVTLDLDGTVTYAFDFQGTVSDGWATADAAVTQSNEYVKIPVRVAGVTPTLYILAGETWS